MRLTRRHILALAAAAAAPPAICRPALAQEGPGRPVRIVTGFAPIGETCAALDAMEHELAAAGIRLTRLRRQWDEIAWPQAPAGFFRFREVIPDLVALAAQ